MADGLIKKFFSFGRAQKEKNKENQNTEIENETQNLDQAPENADDGHDASTEAKQNKADDSLNQNIKTQNADTVIDAKSDADNAAHEKLTATAKQARAEEHTQQPAEAQQAETKANKASAETTFDVQTEGKLRHESRANTASQTEDAQTPITETEHDQKAAPSTADIQAQNTEIEQVKAVAEEEDDEVELTPFEAWQKEQKQKAEKKAQRQAERATVSPYASEKPRNIDQAGLVIHQEEDTASQDTAETKAEAPQKSWLSRLKQGMSHSSHKLNQSISSVFTKSKLDEEALEDLEDVLLQSDLGLETTLKITDRLRDTKYGKDISSEEVNSIMADEISTILQPCAQNLELDLSHKPHVILVVGVNGTGKTTTIGKLAAKLRAGGLSVMMAAGDTFRAAAIEQLHVWGKRTGSEVISSKIGGDAASLAFDAYKQAKEAGSDVLLIDTAGRLQNKTELMEELAKIVRVLKKLDSEAPHTVLQNLDATTGQNALAQVEIFKQTADVSGLVMTKLDGTARGGILVSIAAKYKLPIYFIGVGEGVADLEPFSAQDFAQAIVGK